MDIHYLLFLQHVRELFGNIFDSFFMRVTSMGESVITFLLLAFVYWCVDKRAGQLMALNVSVACTWNQAVKKVCKIERPWVRDERIHPVSEALAGAGGYSFPSGHTQRATAVWGALGVSLWKKKERVISGICFAILALIAFSRNYLGVHTPQDVLVALFAGILLIWILEKVLDWVEHGPGRDYLVAVIGCLLCFIPMLKVGCLSNAGAGMGFMIGWVLERHFIHFETRDSRSHKCVKFSIGGTCIILILTVLQSLLNQVMESKYAGFFTMFCLAVFIMAVYPYFFSKRQRYKAGLISLLVLLVLICAFSMGWQRHLQNLSQDVEGSPDTMIEESVGTVEENSTAEETISDNVSSVLESTPLPQVVAHRGYSAVFPENTLAAFAGAIDIGVDFIELDVQLSKDGQVVVFHDTNLNRITGTDGAVSDYTYEELSMMDAGSWFSPAYVGERIPTLLEVLQLIKDSDCRVYLELKDIGDVEGFEEAVLDVTNQCGMTERCIFASFRYEYLAHFKELDAGLLTLYNTTSGNTTLPADFPADYYGLYMENVTAAAIDAIHQAGKQAFVWTVNTPQQIRNVQIMGADGIVTNYPGIAKVVRHPEYSFLVDRYEASFAMPGLYGPELPEQCQDMVVQGLTHGGSYLVVSAYSKSGENNSILYIMDLNGNLRNIVDLGFKAHTGGISYDEAHDLLWVTGPEGQVYAISWSAVISGTYQGEILVSFDAGLVNHNGSKVASFLTIYENELYVGSYVNGNSGILNRYDLSQVETPQLVSSVTIPERIQGITFSRNMQTGECYMYLSQGYQTEDSHLLKFLYRDDIMVYADPMESHVLPEGSEQIQMTARGMYILFESAVRPYRPTARIVNDQIYLIRE